MTRAVRAVRVVAASAWSDALLGALLLAAVLGDLIAHHELGSAHWAELGSAVVCCGIVPLRRRHPLAAVLFTAAAAALPGVLTSAQTAYSLPTPAFVTGFLLTYSLGTSVGLGAGLVGTALLVAGVQAGIRIFNPLVEMLTVGPWVAGRVMLSRRALLARLETRNRELEEERESFAREAVRYERARIARELHDIVAHSVSMMVVQAGAGQRLVDQDPALAAEALEVIAETAREARGEIDSLVELLGIEPSHAEPALIEELIRRATATGLEVTCRIRGDHGRLAPEVWGAAYRVVQESLTNAIKHAPGARVELNIGEEGGVWEIEVLNAPPLSSGSSGLSTVGGGHGLGGMRSRIAALSGEFTAGPTREGGWLVSARLPIRPPAVTTSRE